MKKTVTMFVLLLLCSSIFAFAQETTDASDSEPACNLGCKVWQFLFGSKEARAGKAWFDRGALVGMADACKDYGPTDTYCWHEQGFSNEDKDKWKTAGVTNAFTANKYKAKDFTPEFTKQVGTGTVDAWLNQPSNIIQNQKVRTLIQRGWTPSQVDNMGTSSAGSPIDTAYSWGTGPVALDYKQNGWTLENVNSVGGPMGANTYASAGLNPQQAKFLYDQNIRSIEDYNKLDTIKRTDLSQKGNLPSIISTEEILLKQGSNFNNLGNYATAADFFAQACNQGSALGCNSATANYKLAGNSAKETEYQEKAKKNPITAEKSSEAQSSATAKSSEKTPISTTPTAPASTAQASAPVSAAPSQTVLSEEELVKRNLKAQQVLGNQLYHQYGGMFIDYQSISTNPADSRVTTYPLLNNMGKLDVFEEGGYVTITGKTNIPNAQGQATEWSVLRKDGQTLAAQTLDQLKQGVMAVGPTGEVVTVGKGVTPNSLRSGKPVYNVENGEKVGSVQYAEDKLEIVDFNKETQTVFNTRTQEKESLTIDYYQKGESGCTTDGGCKVATGGTATILTNGKLQEYLVDYDYKTSGVDRAKSENLEDKEYFNPSTGRQEGVERDGTKIIAQRNNEKGGYSGEYSITGANGGEVVVKRSGQTWIPTSSPRISELQKTVDNLNQKAEEINLKIRVAEQSQMLPADASEQSVEEYLENQRQQLGEIETSVDEKTQELQEEKQEADKLASELTKKYGEDLDSIESSSQGTLAGWQTALQSVYSITNNLKSYPAISNLLFGEADFYKKWRSDMDKAFAPLLASNWFPSAICENGVTHWQDIEPEGKAVIKTTSGTYQAVASIQMERSPETSPILCHKNPDEDSEELFICESKQVCVDDNFCYADNDRDNEPDNNEPLKGFFYKVTWAVSSPQDEAFTPLRDENGVAVSFNVFLYPGAVPMYNLDGNIASPIQLQNGASDKDTIIKYSTKEYKMACIRWNQAPVSIGIAAPETPGAFGAGWGPVEDVCFGEDDDGFSSSIGQVNWDRSGKSAASVTASHGEVNKNTDW